MKLSFSIGLISLSMVLSSCAVIESRTVSANEASADGVVYYLPKRLVRFEFERKAVDVAKAEVETAMKALADAKMAYEATNAAVQAADEILSDLKKTPTNSTKAIDDQQAEVAKAEALRLASNRKYDIAAEALSIKMRASPSDAPTFADVIIVTALAPVADTSRRYSARLSHYWSRSDDLTLKTTTSGLLTTANAKAEDKSSDIVISIAKFAAIFLGSVPIGTTGPASEGKNSQANGSASSKIFCGLGSFERYRDASAQAKPFKLDLIFDPVSDKFNEFVYAGEEGAARVEHNYGSPWKYVETALCVQGADYKLDWAAISPSFDDALSPTTSTKCSEVAENEQSTCTSGIYYRREVPYRVLVSGGTRISDSDGEKWGSLVPISAAQVELPNGSPAELLKVDGSLFGTSDYKFEFTNGMLISATQTKSSELLTVAQLPYEIVKALISVPADLFSFKVNYSSEAAADAKNRVELLEQQLKLLKAQKALDVETATPP